MTTKLLKLKMLIKNIIASQWYYYNASMDHIPGFVKTHVEMFAPLLMMYCTSRLASIPAFPPPCVPTTRSTADMCVNPPANRLINSARSAGW